MKNLFTTIWQDRRHPPRKEIVAQLMLSVIGFATSTLALTATATFTHRMIVEGGVIAYGCAVAMGGLGLLLLCDTFVNDILPRKYHLLWIRHRRQHMWMALGLLFVLFAYLVFTAHLSVSLGTYLVVYALGSFMVAFVDAATEKMEDQRQCRTP